MNGGTIALMMAGFIAFGVGAYLAATDSRTLGITMMAMGLMFQMLTLRQIRIAKSKGSGDARR